jgi:transcriptional regulator with XRE-family HTH domain
MDINSRVASRLFQLRGEYGLSIEALADRSGVSRAMISKIERAECSATITTLNKLSIGLGVLLPSLLGPGDYKEPRLGLRNPVASRKAQPQWLDPDSGYRRRTLTPSTANQPLQLNEIQIPAGARITLEHVLGGSQLQQQLWMLEGEINLRLGDQSSALKTGDCMALTINGPVTLHNGGSKTARYLMATATSARSVSARSESA